jgi:hypothetical protein
MDSVFAWLVLHPAELVEVSMIFGVLLAIAIGWWWHDG